MRVASDRAVRDAAAVGALPDTAVRGQALVLIVGGLCGLLIGALVLGAVARGLGVRSDAQRAADLAALAGARAMLDAYPRLFEAPTVDGRPNPRHLEKGTYLALGRAAAARVAERNGGGTTAVSFPDATTLAPVRIRVQVGRSVDVRRGHARASTHVSGVAVAELAPVTQDLGPSAAGGEYAGALAHRQGKPMRPDVARTFDRMAAAARKDGIALLINSAYRSDAEQAVLFARHPDPKWVARPGTSLHRYGTELDIGPPAAYGWLDAHGAEFHFVQRYSWEEWHWGYTLNAKSSRSENADGRSTGATSGAGGGGSRGSMPSFVPARFALLLARAAQRWNVSSTLLAAQLYAESGFNPFARSPVGALGLAQFMPATARAYGLSDPFDPAQAIAAQAHLMRDLLRDFASVPLALAAYNAGPAPVRACGCVPPYPETKGYVARILGLMGGAGEAAGGGLAVRLVQ